MTPEDDRYEEARERGREWAERLQGPGELIAAVRADMEGLLVELDHDITLLDAVLLDHPDHELLKTHVRMVYQRHRVHVALEQIGT